VAESARSTPLTHKTTLLENPHSFTAILRSAYALPAYVIYKFPNYDITNKLEYFVLSLLIYIRNLYPSVNKETVRNKDKIVCTSLYLLLQYSSK
jgi:hypothetical protein